MAMNNFDIARGFLNRADIEKLLGEIKVKKQIDFEVIGEGKLYIAKQKEYKQKIALKLKLIFQRQIQLDFKEAINYYNSNIESLKERLLLLYDIIDYVNYDIDIPYYPDKLTIASYFRVNADVFDALQNDAQVEIEVQKIFQEVNEFILSSTLIGLESGALNGYSYNRLKLKSRFGGNQIEEHKTESGNTTLIVSSDIQRKLATDYDFTKMLDNKKSEENKEGK